MCAGSQLKSFVNSHDYSKYLYTYMYVYVHMSVSSWVAWLLVVNEYACWLVFSVATGLPHISAGAAVVAAAKF